MEKFLEEVFTTIKKKNIIKRTTMMIISLMLSALIYNYFILPTNLVTGGINGIAVITKHLYNIEPSIIISLGLIVCAIISFIFLGAERTSGALVSCVLYPIFVEITSPLPEIFPIETSDMFLITIFCGVLMGLANGLMYKTDYSNGGLQVISQILYKYYKIPISQSSLVINAVIVGIGGIFFGWTMVMYAVILLYISSVVIDKVLLGISNNKAFYIITSEEKKVKDYIMKVLKHGVTTFDVKGAFLEKKRKVLLAVIPSREYFKVTEGIKLIDENAFFVVTDSYEVKGGK